MARESTKMKKEFVVLAFSKKDIATRLGLKKTDKRLTDKFCKEFAKRYGDAMHEIDPDDVVEQSGLYSEINQELGIEEE